MFAKPIRVRSQNLLKGSDRKKFRAEVLKTFPTISDKELQTVIPNKAEITLIKIYIHKGDGVHLYQVDKDPLFFMHEKDRELYPTVYFLWQFPKLMSIVFTTHGPVIPKLCQGADLMLPGVVLQTKEIRPTSYGKFGQGEMVAVNTEDNFHPVAVGVTARDSMDLYMAARQGKAVFILHAYKDHLWAMGSKSTVPPLNTPEDDSEKNDAGIREQELCENMQDASLQNDEPKEALSETESMDMLFESCFLKAWKTSAKKIELPVLTSNFYRLHMVPACPSGRILDVKKSSYKKLSKFLGAMKEKKIINIKEFPKGVENITEVCLGHDDIKNYYVDLTEVSQVVEPAKKDNGFSPVILEEVYQTSGKTINFYKSAGVSRGSVLSKNEVRQVVTDYVKRKKLQRESCIELDVPLHEAVVGPKEGYKETLSWGEIFSRLLGAMPPAIRIHRKDEYPIIQKGKLQPIEIAVAKRSGNKKVTLIYNLSTYGIDEQEFAHRVQVGVATSTCVGPAEHKPQGVTQVLIQGNQVNYVGKLLLESYQIPIKHIRGLELAVKRKK